MKHQAPSSVHSAPLLARKLSRRFRPLWRGVVFLHRWIGVALCLLMTVWTVSGIVMMYVSFPELSEAESLAGLPAIDMTQCCDLDFINSDAVLSHAAISMQKTPVLVWREGNGAVQKTGLTTRLETSPPTPDAIRQIALVFAQHAYGAATLKDVKTVSADQWTVSGKYNVHRPLAKVSFYEPSGHVLYLSSQDGSVVLDTNYKERFWNWFGAVPHWLYYTGLRKHQALWYDLIVWTSVFASLTTALGLYLGLCKYQKGRHKFFPYKGVMHWHQVIGLVFGVFTFTWVVSGLFSMNPWDLMEGGHARIETGRLETQTFSKGDIQNLINIVEQRAQDERPDKDVIEAKLIGLQGQIYALLTTRGGQNSRLNLKTQARETPAAREIETSVNLIRPQTPIGSLDYLEHEDAYYYGHKGAVTLPVWRVIMKDEEATRYYFSAESGRLIKKVDRAAKQYRWLHDGLHRLDFTASLRMRPVWDIMTLLLLLGVSALCATGTWLGWRRINRNLQKIGD